MSTTGDPTGSYARYAFSFGNQFPDYPKLGVWPDAYYLTFNLFLNGGSFSGPQMCALDRAKMLAGQPATQQCFTLSTSHGSLLPSDLDGPTPPPAGAPNSDARVRLEQPAPLEVPRRLGDARELDLHRP